MRGQVSRRFANGFTLVELLIVVIIVAILAAIVVPQFNDTTSDAKEAALDSNLQAVRAAMELYKLQHNATYPGAKPTNAGGSCTEAKGAATAAGKEAFVEQLTKVSDVDGNTCGVAEGNYKYGPYLKPSVPNNPITGKGSQATDIVVTSDGKAIVATANGGWAVDTKSGQFIANDTTESNGKAYSTR